MVNYHKQSIIFEERGGERDFYFDLVFGAGCLRSEKNIEGGRRERSSALMGFPILKREKGICLLRACERECERNTLKG